MPASPRSVALVAVALIATGCAHTQRVSSTGRDWIEPGNTYEGRTSELNSAREGEPVELRFEGKAGQRVRFRLESPKREVLAAGLVLRTADDEKVELHETDTGTPDVEVSSALLPVTGEYSVEVHTSDLFFGTFADFRLRFDVDPTPEVVELAMEKPVTGELMKGDRTDLFDQPGDLYRVRTRTRQRCTFIVKSDAFEPSLRIFQRGLGNDPEWSSGGEETLTVEDEVYVLVLSGSDDKQLGPYTLVVRDARAYEMANLPVLEVGARVDGELSQEGKSSPTRFKVRGIPGVDYVIDARSADFDIALMVYNNLPLGHPELKGAQDNNGAGGTNARLRIQFPDRDEWVLNVSSQSEEPSGRFWVAFNTADNAPPISPDEKAHMVKGVKRPVKELYAGSTVSASLSSGTGAPGYAGRDVYMFHGKEGQAVTLVLQSADFEGVVSLTQLGAKAPLGAATVKQGGPPARLEATLPGPSRADYLIQIEPVDGRSQGRYTLEMQ